MWPPSRPPRGWARSTPSCSGLLKPGDHLIAQKALYGGTAAMINDLASRFGIAVTHVPGDDPAALRAAVRPETRLVYLETIANPVCQVADLPAMCAAAKELGLVSVVDNTFASPILCRPLEHGADIVVHSTTKYLSGHTDVLGGIAVFAADELYRKVWHYAIELGSTPDPFAAWLTLRGMQTLPLRMERHCANTRVLATRLAGHPAVSAVHWPGLLRQHAPRTSGAYKLIATSVGRGVRLRPRRERKTQPR
ncbi:trans-sulfuration enzyme family protein [Nonomuraea dietziae]|uniref:trans-sulfuration enzyme family protein n=1 Tax=Nonomuraea dietziae TaxID=65515 RepID=UPI0031DE707E